MKKVSDNIPLHDASEIRERSRHGGSGMIAEAGAIHQDDSGSPFTP
jgi:hypothetical protein